MPWMPQENSRDTTVSPNLLGKYQMVMMLRRNTSPCLKSLMWQLLSFAAVRFGRVPKREKARIEAAMQQSTRNRTLTTNVWTDLEDLQNVIDTVVGAHLETCEFTRERVREMKLKAKGCPNYTEPTRVSRYIKLHSKKLTEPRVSMIRKLIFILTCDKVNHCEGLLCREH